MNAKTHNKEKLIEKIVSGENKSFCMMPFLSVTAHQTGAFRLCCRDEGIVKSEILGNIKTSSIEQMRNSDIIRKIRLKMLHSQEIPACKACYKTELRGIMSAREKFNNKIFKDYLNDIFELTDINTGVTNQPVKHLDLRFSNICNLSCRMCFSGSSSSRRDLDRITGRTVEEIVHSKWDIKDFENIIDDLDVVYIAGGEPFVDKDFIPFLEFLISSGKSEKIVLICNTNLTILSEEHIILFSKFKEANIIVSCDGYDKVYEYIRIGGKWETFLSNLIFLRKNLSKFGKNSEITMNTVVQIDNIYNILFLYQFCHKLGVKLTLSILERPRNMYIGIIPTIDKNKILKYYDDFISKNKSKFPNIENDFSEIISILKASKEDSTLYRSFIGEKNVIDSYVTSGNNINNH